MKYKWYSQTIPQTKRKEINDKITYLINQNLLSKYQVTAEDIYNSYTGKGHLTDIQFKDYNNYYEFSQARKIEEQGEFFTPHNICEFVMNSLKPDEDNLICDMTSGIGNFCNFTPMEENVYLNDIDLNNVKIMRQLYSDANITNNDIKVYEPNIKFDLIVGNPPYGLKFNTKEGEFQSQFYYCIKTQQLLKPWGIMCIVVPNSFMNDDFTDKGIINYMNQYFNFICQYDLPVNSFKQVGINKIETKVMIFQRKSENLEQNKPYTLDKINIDLTEEYSDLIYSKYIKPLYDEKEKLKGKLTLEMIKHNNIDNEEFRQFEFKVKKLLFDIKRNPKIKQYYNKAFALYNKYLNQKQPEEMDWKEWNKKRLTKKKVIRHIKDYLNKQHEVEIDKIELVKWNYGLKLKGYSRKNKMLLNKTNSVKEMSFNDMILNKEYPFEDKKYYKLYLKKLKQYEKQSIKFKDMKEDREVKKFLDELTIKDYENNFDIKLNDVQKYELNKMLQKNYGLLQFGCGTGKSLLGLSAIQYRFEQNTIDNAFIIAPAIAINNTFDVILKDYKMNYIRINKLEDINNIKKGQIVIITFNILIKYKKFISKFIKQHNQRIMLLLDEADNITSMDSKRSKATLSTFKHCRYKLLTTATSTRNNCLEIYNEIALMLNHSVNMLNKCKYIYSLDKKTNELQEKSNEYYMKPIPPYKKGYNLFSQMHQPSKTTILGLSKQNQDIYNSKELKDMLDRLVITRTFEEVCGKKIYDIKQVTCKFSETEKELYSKIINEFYALRFNYFNSTGNYRKDAMFIILQQLNLLIKSCSVPHTFKEYHSTEMATKFKKVNMLVNKYNNSKIAIGCRFIKTVNSYYNYLSSKYPNRPIFIITGESTTLNKRKEVIKELEQTENGILICTQASLSSSMNIDFIDTVIIPELDFNNSKMQQFYFRFIRFTSKNQKQVIFVTYENSIESNILQLVLSKERINLFMKDKEVDIEELWDEFGVDFNILNMLMSKEEDSDGKMRISWGEQEII